MRSLFAVLFLSILFSSAAQQPANKATAVLKSVSQRLNSLSAVSYSYIREMKYYADNYDSRDTADIYMEFKKDLPLGVRFQAARKKDLYVYNGRNTFDLDASAMTIDSATPSSDRLLSNSFLYNSMVMLRNNLPMLIANDSFSKVLTDTLVNGKSLFSIRMEAPMVYLNAVNGIGRMDNPSLRRPYFLLVDKKTYLPYQFVSKLVNGNDDRDYIRVTYSGVKTNPAARASGSWTYAFYQATYKAYEEPAQIPVIATGARMPDFRLPVYNGSVMDTLSFNELKDKVVLVEFWFKSCGPCIKAMPKYNALQDKYKGQGFELVTVNLEDPVEDLDFFYKKYPPHYRMLYHGLALFNSLGFDGCPSSVLVDRSGKVVKTFYGYDEEAVGDSIAAVL